MSKIIIATVIAVISGDSFHIRLGNESFSVRVAGIEAPGYGEKYSIDAEQTLARLCYQKKATIRYDKIKAKNSIVGTVRCNRQDVALAMVRSGLVMLTNADDEKLSKPLARAKERGVGRFSEGREIKYVAPPFGAQ